MMHKFKKSVLSEQTEDTDEKIQYNTNEFFNKVLKPISINLNVILSKQSNNTFLVYGYIEDLTKFFNNLKVKKDFMEDPSEFRIYSPLFSFGDVTKKMNVDQYFPTDHFEKYKIPTTHEIENETGNILEGNWYNFKDDDQRAIKSLKPTEIGSKIFKEMFKGVSNEDLKQYSMYIEFQVNTENLKNLLWDEMSEYAISPDEMNEFHNKEPEKFDYTKLNVKNGSNIMKKIKTENRNMKKFNNLYSTILESISPTYYTKVLGVKVSKEELAEIKNFANSDEYKQFVENGKYKIVRNNENNGSLKYHNFYRLLGEFLKEHHGAISQSFIDYLKQQSKEVFLTFAWVYGDDLEKEYEEESRQFGSFASVKTRNTISELNEFVRSYLPYIFNEKFNN